MERENILAFKVAEIVRLAQANKKDEAIKVMRDAELQLVGKKASDVNHRLIELLKVKYRLVEAEQEIQQEFVVSENIGSGREELKSGVSIVSCCRNRSENALIAIPTWLAHKEIREIIIVDWMSDIPVSEILTEHGIQDRRIRVVRVENEPRWILSYAFNLGFRLARYSHILKVDADITLKEDFFDKNPLLAGTFIAGDWTKAEKGQEHINGFFFVKTKDLLRVKGFNEYITTYGWDDDDIYSRFKASGLQRICVDTKSIYHIPHDDASRLDGVGKSDGNAWAELSGDPLHKIRTNRYIAMVMPCWNGDRTYAPFKILNINRHILAVERILQDMPHYVSATMRRDAEIYAATEILSWRVGPAVFHLERGDFDHLLKLKRLDEISQFDVDLMVKGLVDKSKLKKHSVYLEFELKGKELDFGPLKRLILELKSTSDAAIFVSSYGEGSARFVSENPNDVTRLRYWVRSTGLKTINKDNLADIHALSEHGPGCHLKITDELLEFLAQPKPLVQVKARKDRLFIDTQHGLGNRLRAYGSAAAIARATGRELVVVWVPDVHCECKFKDLFDYDGIVIDSYDDVPDNVIRYNYMEIEADGKKDAEIILEKSFDVLARSAYVLKHPSSIWDAECTEIKLLKPTEEVVSLINSVALHANAIGVHVRMEAGKGCDHNAYDSQENWSKESHDQIHFWREKSHYSSFIKRLNALIDKDQSLKIFLATDLPENYEVFIKIYGDRLIYLPRSVYGRAKEQILYGLADAILLSKTQRLLGSTWSSFTEIAMRFSKGFSKIEMSGVDF